MKKIRKMQQPSPRAARAAGTTRAAVAAHLKPRPRHGARSNEIARAVDDYLGELGEWRREAAEGLERQERIERAWLTPREPRSRLV